MSCYAFDLVGEKKTFRKLNVIVMIKNYLQQNKASITFKSEILKEGFCRNYRNPSRSATAICGDLIVVDYLYMVTCS